MPINKVNTFNNLSTDLDRSLNDLFTWSKRPLKYKKSTDITSAISNNTEYLEVDTNTNTITLTLPDVSLFEHRKLTIKDINGNASNKNITIIPAENSASIDGSSSFVINNDYDSVSLYSNGSNWQVLHINSAPSGGTSTATETESGVRVYRNAALAVPNTGVTLVTFDTELWDSNNEYDTSTGKFTAKQAGKYQINAKVSFGASSSASCGIEIYVNGAIKSQARYGYLGTLFIADVLSLSANDYVQIYVYQSSGTSSLNINTGETWSSLSIFKLN